jgi:hypothetical protein
MIHASEDVGLADNTALQTAVAASQAVEKIGYPESQIILAHAALHVARAPKSGSVTRGIGAALGHVEHAGVHKEGDLLDHGEGVGDAASPELGPEAVDAVLEFAGDHGVLPYLSTTMPVMLWPESA